MFVGHSLARLRGFQNFRHACEVRIIESNLTFQENIAFKYIGIAVSGSPGFEVDQAHPPWAEPADGDRKVTAMDDSISDGFL